MAVEGFCIDKIVYPSDLILNFIYSMMILMFEHSLLMCLLCVCSNIHIIIEYIKVSMRLEENKVMSMQ